MNKRRSFFKSVAALSATISTVPMVMANEVIEQPIKIKALPSLKGRKILFTYGGWKGHEPKVFKDYLVPWLESEGAEVVVSDTIEVYTDEELMNSIDLVVQTITMDQMTREQEAGLLKAIRDNGTGMAGWHGGMGDSFRINTDYQFMVGGQWVAHPGGFVDYTVHITNHKDEITNGISDFNMNSEQYYMHVDPNVKVLATTKFNGENLPWIEGCTMPVIWKKSFGKGRVFYTSLGHFLTHVIDQPSGMEIIKRGIQWASASKYIPEEKWVSPKY